MRLRGGHGGLRTRADGKGGRGRTIVVYAVQPEDGIRAEKGDYHDYEYRDLHNAVVRLKKHSPNAKSNPFLRDKATDQIFRTVLSSKIRKADVPMYL